MDYLNPTPQQIRDLGSDPDAEWPDEEWDSTVATRENADLILVLASEGALCP